MRESLVKTPSPATDLVDARGVSISEVCSVLGVPMSTLRSWELRYSMPTFRQQNGRHRRYPPAQVHAIRLMRDEVARGQQAAVAAATVRRVLGIGGVAGVFIHQLLACSERLDSAGMRISLDEAAAALGLAGCVDEVLLPTMRQVGVWREIGHCDGDQERLTTESVRNWLHRKASFAPLSDHPRPIVLACGPNDLHTIGLESLATLLRYQGWPCRVLGARTPTLVVVAAVKAADAAAVVLVSQLATGRRTTVESIQAIKDIHLPVFYAGSSFATDRSRKGVPGHYLGTSITQACAQVITAVTDTGIPKAS